MRHFSIETDTVSDEDLGDFVLEEINVTVYDDGTLELSQPEFGDEASTIGLTIGQASKLYELLHDVIGGGVGEDEVDEASFTKEEEEVQPIKKIGETA